MDPDWFTSINVFVSKCHYKIDSGDKGIFQSIYLFHYIFDIFITFIQKNYQINLKILHEDIQSPLFHTNLFIIFLKKYLIKEHISKYIYVSRCDLKLRYTDKLPYRSKDITRGHLETVISYKSTIFEKRTQSNSIYISRCV